MEAAFGALADAERLKAAGMETSQANAHADALRIAFSEGVATKADIREVRADIAGLASRVDNIDENMATKTELARVETRLQRSINRAMFAMAGLIIALAAAIITAVGLM